MTKVTVIQFRRNETLLVQEQELFREPALRAGVSVNFLNVNDPTVDWRAVAAHTETGGVILGGSGDFDFDAGRATEDPARRGAEDALSTLAPFLVDIFSRNTPTLGICFGHQLMARFCGARVLHAPHESKVGTYDVSRTSASRACPLMADMPHSFSAHFAHNDSVVEVPRGASVIAENARCSHSAISYSDKIYGVQFHPEITNAHAPARLAQFACTAHGAHRAPVREAEAGVLLDMFFALVQDDA